MQSHQLEYGSSTKANATKPLCQQTDRVPALQIIITGNSQQKQTIKVTEVRAGSVSKVLAMPATM